VSVGTEQLRRTNTGVVLRALRGGAPQSRAELAQRTGLAKATVGVIVGDLVAAGALTETPDLRPGPTRAGGRGRPGRPVAPSPGAFVGLGLELNVDYVSAVVADLGGGVVSSRTRPVDPDDTDAPQRELLSLVEEVVGALEQEGSRLLGACVALPALVRGDGRTIAWAPNLSLTGEGTALALEERLPGCPVRISNDANCAAYAEALHGAAQGVRHAVYLTGTVGLGAGILRDGQVVSGGAGFAGEVGHVPVGDPDALCGCGRHGCWEASVGLRALLARLGMAELEDPLTTAARVAERAATEPDVRAAVEQVGRDLGLGLAMLTGVLDPEVVVLGGYLAALGELVIDPARAVLDARLSSPAQTRPELRPGVLGTEAAALGAAERTLVTALSGEVDLARLSAGQA